MKGLLTFLTVVIVLAIIRAILVALLVGLALMLLYSSITRPRETLVFLGTLTLFGLVSAQPIACIIAIATVALAVVVAGALQRSRCRPLLTDESEHDSQAGGRLDRDPPGQPARQVRGRASGERNGDDFDQI
ncbi:MAG: hypothetical protein B7Y86_11210 [Brevundimonas subvibrioides]|uniref:Uncharacterized protein n=1 Tax=Brevundimonas subvibrioides TaxID=74313 RepID=A0A258HGX8_9CAUL|nr:hypothetical protein [Brevundimonas subvibrioides]OYX56009.1 MAG: hypothetical protein B7Y86_11210 [Brevundimonas subvibrioides]